MNLKEFLIDTPKSISDNGELFVSIEKLGLFYWERGGKDLPNVSDWYNNFDKCLEFANKHKHNWLEARDFLDALACLGEDKVKELIKELK